MKHLILSFILFLVACTKKEALNSAPFLVKTDSISIPLVELATHQGHFIDHKKDLFYSYHINTNKLFIYDRNGVIDSLNLNKHQLHLNQIAIKNLDSIFIIDYSNRHIKQITIEGVVKNDFDFKKASHQDSITPYLFKTKAFEKNILLLDRSYSHSKDIDLFDSDLEKKHKSLPVFIYIKENKIKYANLNLFDVESISKKDTEGMPADYASAIITEKYIVFTMQFNNQIYLFDKEAHYIKNIPILSTYTGTDINKDYTIQNLLPDMDLYRTNYDYATLTKYTAYNKQKNSIYLLLAHKTDLSIKKNSIDKASNRSFSIIRYDEHFNKRGEQKFKKNIYNIYTPFYISHQGYLLLDANNQMTPHHAPYHMKYDVYKEI